MSAQPPENRTIHREQLDGASLEALAARLVGHLPLDSTRNRVSRAMLLEALVRSRGNYSRAALLLGVRRQAVQQMVSRMDLRDWVTAVKLRADRD